MANKTEGHTAVLELLYLMRHGEWCTTADVGERVRIMQPQTVCPTMTKARAAGLVERADTRVGRSMLHRITDEGRRAVARMSLVHLDTFERLHAPPAPPAPSYDRVKIFKAVGSAYDDTRGCYLDGHSDAEIARLLDVPEDVVAQVRDEHCGPAHPEPEEDPAIVKLRADAERIRAMLDDLFERLEARCDE